MTMDPFNTRASRDQKEPELVTRARAEREQEDRAKNQARDRHDPRHSRQYLENELLGNAFEAVANSLDQYINTVFGNISRPKCIMALPKFLAKDYYLGTEVALSALTLGKPSGVQILYDIADLLLSMRAAPTIIHHAKFIAEKNFTLGEAYWLVRITEVLGCLDPKFGPLIQKELDKADPGGLVNQRNYLGSSEDTVALGEKILAQYEILNNLLKEL